MLIATQDLLPGTEVFTEDKPLLSYSDAFLKSYYEIWGAAAKFLAGYEVFAKQLTVECKEKFLGLFRSFGFLADEMRSLARNLAPSQGFTGDDVELFVKVANIMKLYEFDEHGRYSVYETASRVQHSCSPNCFLSFANRPSVTCRTIMAVKKGDLLTFNSYNSRARDPIYMRRAHLLAHKEITCHCPRCDSPGDDTRQFSCFDNNKCKGRHMVCHPREKAAMTESRIPYTGVEYVEPHLLPCTDCGRAPPLEYQQRMFELEAQLPCLSADYTQKFEEATSHSDFKALRCLMSTIHTLTLPPAHMNATDILHLIVKEHVIFRAPLQELRSAVERYVRQYEHMLQFPNAETIKVLSVAAASLLEGLRSRDDGFAVVTGSSVAVCSGGRLTNSTATSEHRRQLMINVVLAKGYLQRTYRMVYLLEGRNGNHRISNDLTLFAPLQRALAALPPQAPTTTACIFCGETPQCAAITLSRCGRCKKVTYCSALCQKAHWTIHKKQCV